MRSSPSPAWSPTLTSRVSSPTEVYIYAVSALAHLAIGSLMFRVVVVAVVVKEDYIAQKFRSLRGGAGTEDEGGKLKED